VGARCSGGARDSACGGTSGYNGTHGTLTGGGGGGNSLKGGDGRSQVGQSDTRGDRSDGCDVDGRRGRLVNQVGGGLEECNQAGSSLPGQIWARPKLLDRIWARTELAGQI
jgi:hypothetical protein